MLRSSVIAFLLTSGCLLGEWQSSPTEVSPLNPGTPSLAYSDSGIGLAGGGSGNYYAYRFNGTAWEPGVLLSTGVINNSSTCLALDAQGNGLAVYSTGSSVRASRYDVATNTWFDTLGSSIELYGSVARPAVALSAQGDGLAIYQTNPIVYASQYNGTTHTWSDTMGSAIQLNTATGVIQSSYLAMNSIGDGLAVWGNNNGNLIIQSSVFDGVTKTWSNTQGSAISLSTPYTFGSLGGIAMSNNGTGLAVWVQDGPLRASWYDGSTWQHIGASAYTLAASSNGTLAQVAMDANGNGVAIWATPTNIVQVSLFNAATQTWSSPTALSSPGAISIPSMKVSFDGVGNIFAAWIENNGSDTTVQSSFYNHVTGLWENTLGDAFILSDVDEDVASSLSLEANSHGNALAVFPQGNYPNFGLYANFYTPPQPINGSDFTGTAKNDKFLSQYDHVHFLNWKASSDPSVIGYLIRANGTIIADILSGAPLKLVLHNQIPNLPITYTLVSYDDLDIESNPLTVILK